MSSAHDPYADGNLASKLTRYTFATAGGVAGMTVGFESSEAGLVVIDTSICIEDNSTTTAMQDIDIDNDGSADVRIQVADGAGGLLVAQALNAGASGGLAGATGVGGFWYPSALAVGDLVGASKSFSGYAGGAPNAFGTLAMEATGDGNWVGGVDAYLGVKFTDALNNVLYGWVHIVWDPTDIIVGDPDQPDPTGPDPNTPGGAEEDILARFKIDSYGFNDMGMAALIVPEPSSLLLLGLGAAGLARRRRQG